MNKKIIPIFFTIDDGYAKFLTVAVKSLIENASKDYDYKIHVIHEDLTEENHNNILKRDWIRRANKFNNNYFNDTIKMISCLKDCYNLHKWNKIMVNFKEIDLQKSLKKKDFVAVDTIAGAACSGGVCEIIF